MSKSVRIGIAFTKGSVYIERIAVRHSSLSALRLRSREGVKWGGLRRGMRPAIKCQTI